MARDKAGVTATYPALHGGHLQSASDLSNFHTTTHPVVVDTLARLPRYVQARRALVVLAEYRMPDLDVPPNPATAVAAGIGAALAAGDPIPDDLLALVPDRARDQEAHQAAVQGLLQAKMHAATTLDLELRPHLTTLHATVTDALGELVGRARAHGVPPADADTAVRQDRVDAYRSGQALDQEYVHLRVLQRELERVVGTILTTMPLAFPWYVANPADVIDRAAALLTLAASGGTSAAGSDLPEDWGTGEALWWFVTHDDAEPWAPTAEQQAGVRRDMIEPPTPRERQARAARQAAVTKQIRIHQRQSERSDIAAINEGYGA